MKAKAQSYYDKEYFDTNPDKGYPGKYDLACAPWPRLARALVLSFGPTLGVTTVTPEASAAPPLPAEPGPGGGKLRTKY